MDHEHIIKWNLSSKSHLQNVNIAQRDIYYIENMNHSLESIEVATVEDAYNIYGLLKEEELIIC